MAKVTWTGTVTSVQPRIRLLRSFDERSHRYHGYVIHLDGNADSVARRFAIALGPAAQSENNIRVGDCLSGQGEPVTDTDTEIADLYKVSKLKVVSRGSHGPTTAPPWHGPAPELAVYRERGHRRLDARAFSNEPCSSCIWGCRMPVEIILDKWNPGRTRHRTETFCYGPLACPAYKAGPTRKVPGSKGMTWEEEDWVDADAVSHRGPDD